MWIKAKTLKELTPAEAAFLGIPLFGQAVYGQSVFMSKVEAQRRLNAALELQGGKMQNPTVAFNLAGLMQVDLIKKFQTVVDLNTPAPVTGDAPQTPADPSVVALAATLELIRQKQTVIADNTEVLKGHHADLVGLLATGSHQLEPIGKMIQDASAGSEGYIKAHGLDVAQSATHVTSLPQILNLTAEHGDAEHSVHFNWRATRIKDVLHVIEMSSDPTGQTGYHQVDVCKPSHYDAMNIAAGTDWFRVAARKGAVQGPWSAPVRFTMN